MGSTLRLLFCCEFYHPSRGGVQEVMRQIAEQLVCNGHEVTVATSYLPQRDFDECNGVRIQQFKVEGNLARGIKGDAQRYRDFVLGFNADAILIKAAQQWTFDALWTVLDQIKARKVFIPCGFSGLFEPDYKAYFEEMPIILRKFDHLIFYAENYRDINFARAHGILNFSVLPNGAGEEEFDSVPCKIRDRLGIADDEFVFLTVGTPISMKGHADVAEAFALLDTGGKKATLILNGNWAPPPAPRLSPIGSFTRTVRTIVLASPPLRIARDMWQYARKNGLAALLKKIALRLGSFSYVMALSMVLGPREQEATQQQPSDVGGRVSIQTWIEKARSQPGKKVLCTELPRPEVVAAFFESNLFVFASVVEYSPLVLFESSAAGLPFLSVPVGNAEEISNWTGGGVICPAEKDDRGYTRVHPSTLSLEMRRLMLDEDLCAKLGQRGRESWKSKFTWKIIARQYERVLQADVVLKDPI